ncbi:MAG: hypothetical protein ACK5KO_10400 [Arachnia sp.]
MIRRYLPTMGVGLALIVSPWVYAGLLVDSYTLADKYDHLELALSNLVPLLFVLLATLLYGLDLMQELTAGAWLPIQVRSGGPWAYLRGHLRRAALIGCGVMALLVVTIAIGTLWLTPVLELIAYGPATASPSSDERFTFSQFFAWGDIAFVGIYAVWVGIHGALYGMLGVLSLINIGNRLLALALPAISQFLIEFLLASLRLERFGFGAAVFSTNMEQGPLWMPLIPTIALCAGIAWLAWFTLRPARSPAGYQ